jgi:hypothetical protein
LAPVREQFLGIPAGPLPILVTAEAIGVARCSTRDDELLDMLVEQEEKSLRDRAEDLRSAPLGYRHTVAPLLRTMGYEASDEPPKQLSDDEINERPAAFSRGA